MRSLVDNTGTINTARSRSEKNRSEDRRIDLVIRELNCYDITVAALQETLWFGKHVYLVGESVVITSGRETPQGHQSGQRGEGVAVVLTGPAREAWRAGGEQWESWGSRIVMVTLGVAGEKTSRLHVFSCYAPTFGATRAEKDQFFDQLQRALDSIPSDDSFVLLGDFNARVGSRNLGANIDQWGKTRGPHGLGELNAAGKELLHFLSLNNATICNTWFQKNRIYKSTWQHPKSKKWHCIDYAIVSARDRRKCLDATVKRGAECNTDHQLLPIKLRMTKLYVKHSQTSRLTTRFDVSKLTGPLVDESGKDTPRGAFQDLASGLAVEEWKEDGSVDEKWNAIRSALTGAAKEVLGERKRSDLDWFEESAAKLEPLFQKRHQLYVKWLSSGLACDKQKFSQARSDARRAVRAAKNAWFSEKAKEAQQLRFGGKKVWKCIRDMQHGRRGLIPSRLGTILDEEGNVCVTTDSQKQRWRRHFTKVLNLESQFNVNEIMKARQRPVRHELAELPTMEELMKAIGKVKNRKAAGSSGILPEMIKEACSDVTFLELLLDMTQTAWKECRVPKDWADAVLVPIPKKGDLKSCDNWRGIALLEVVGKVAARVIQGRLQDLAEEELPESQCGFRKGRGCSDMIFTVRQLVEKSWEHKAKFLLVFVDLKKAYDSVPRKAIWLALSKLRVPESLIQLISSFHCDMQATIRLNNDALEPIDVNNGLRQGCTMAPVLFNLYSCLVVERWNERVRDLDGVGAYLRYKYDNKLFRRYTRNADETEVNECQFADDEALLATTKRGAELATIEYMRVAADFGLTLSIPKTKAMAVGRLVTEEDKQALDVGGAEIESVEVFQYLGSQVDHTGRATVDIEKRIAQASKVYGALKKAVFQDHDLTISTKRKIYHACVLSVLLYGSECWVPLKRDLNKIDSFHNRCVRTILGVTNQQQWSQHITLFELRKRWGDKENASMKVMNRRLEWLGHLARMPDYRTPKVCLFDWLPQARPQGGPRLRWRDVIRKDLRVMGIKEDKWYDEATTSRSGWKSKCREETESLIDKTSNRQLPPKQIECKDCGRFFRRVGDKKRHKCVLERSKPVSEQSGALQCTKCSRWFRSRGGLSVHRCRPGQASDS